MTTQPQPVEALEPRQFFSATPLAHDALRAADPPPAAYQPLKKSRPEPTAINASLSKGGTLSVAGSGGDDQIFVIQSGKYVNVCRAGKKGRIVGLFAFRTARVNFVSVYANSGNDHVNCKGVFRSCVISGGAGNDFIHGSDYVDHIEGNDGNDEIHGHEDGDYIEGNSGNDTLLGQDGHDYLDGGYGLDKMMGGAGNDEIDSHDGQWKDYISGGPGDDRASADKNHDEDINGEWYDGYWEISWLAAADIEFISG